MGPHYYSELVRDYSRTINRQGDAYYVSPCFCDKIYEL